MRVSVENCFKVSVIETYFPDVKFCEGIFSRAKLVMRPHRKHMSPFHIEMMIFLRCNKGLWNEITVEDCFKEVPEAGVQLIVDVEAEENSLLVGALMVF